jgi:DNA-binding beta-propeller fold protein YncE
VVTTLAASSASVGKGPIWITVSTGNNYVYVANYTDSTISAFSTASGVLTALNSGVAYNAPTNVGALGRESTGTYLVALGYGSPSGTQIFAIGSGGGLTENNSVASGASTSIPAAVAMSQ